MSIFGRIVVTGAAGFIGSNLVRHLLRDTKHCVLAIDKLTYAGNWSSLADLDDHPRFQFLQADICDLPRMQSAFAEARPIGVMHLAAESHVDRSIDGPDSFIQTNIVGTHTLLQAARQHFEQLDPGKQRRFRFLHVSTDEVYGSLQLDAPAFNERTRYDPHSPYSASKAASDHLVRAWGDTYGLPILVTNCSNNYGPYQFPEKLIPVVILKAMRGEPIPVYGRGENVRDWLYVEDHARALLRVFADGRPGETYNIGGKNELRNIDLVRLLCVLLDDLCPIAANTRIDAAQKRRIKRYSDLITFVKDRPGHDLRYAMDTTKICSELAWEPYERAETGFRRTVEWYLKNETWWSEILANKHQLQRQGLSSQHRFDQPAARP
jgi:dTDP-glucose 4,6-dehydratase